MKVKELPNDELLKINGRGLREIMKEYYGGKDIDRRITAEERAERAERRVRELERKLYGDRDGGIIRSGRFRGEAY